MQELSKICLFGGTFDPIHNGHRQIAQLAQTTLSIDKVVIIPCRQSPHKLAQKSASAQHRLRMCELATADLAWAEVNTYELQAPSPSYSWKTAEHFKSQYPSSALYWLMGTDQWNALDRWNRHEHLASLVEFIICTRGEETLVKRPFRSHLIQCDHPASSTAIRHHFPSAQAGQWLQPQVFNYIKKAHLY